MTQPNYGPGGRRRGYSNKWDRLFEEVDKQAMSELEETMAGSLRLNGIPPGQREYRFAGALGRKWRFDFAWPEVMLALEVEGGSWVNGAHNRGRHMASDMEKYNTATLLGWYVLRVDNHMVEDNRAADLVRGALIMLGGM